MMLSLVPGLILAVVISNFGPPITLVRFGVLVALATLFSMLFMGRLIRGINEDDFLRFRNKNRFV